MVGDTGRLEALIKKLRTVKGVKQEAGIKIKTEEQKKIFLDTHDENRKTIITPGICSFDLLSILSYFLLYIIRIGNQYKEE